MHESVYEWVRRIPQYVWEGASVLEVGSRNVNGSVRDLIEPHASEYIGVDMIGGDGVDRICRGENLVERFGLFSFDVVVSTETLEHCQQWQHVIENIKAVARETVVLTTRSPGFPYHEHPGDYWRFTHETMEFAFADFLTKHIEQDKQFPGVFIWATRGIEAAPDMSKISAVKVINPNDPHA